MLNQQMSDGPSHLQGFPLRRYNQGCFWLIHSKNACITILLLYIFVGEIPWNSFSPEPSFEPKTISDSGFSNVLRFLVHRKSDGSTPRSYASRQQYNERTLHWSCCVRR